LGHAYKKNEATWCSAELNSNMQFYWSDFKIKLHNFVSNSSEHGVGLEKVEITQSANFIRTYDDYD